MARHPKKGIDYSSWDVDVLLGDSDIDKLMEAKGCEGFTIYFYLCQMAYKFEGYYLKWSCDDAATTAKRVGGGVRSETVAETVNLCLRLGLFHKGLFDRHGILTSRRIQSNYAEATARRRGNVVIADYWLLEKNFQTGGSNKSTHFQDSCDNNPDSCNNNPGFCDNNSPKVEESKVEQSKGKESKEVERTAPASAASSAPATLSPRTDTAYDYFRNNINPSAPQRDYEAIAGYIHHFNERGGDGDAIVIYACQIAQSRRAFAWAFIDNVLNGWKRAGLRTLAECEAHERDWKEKHSRKNGDSRKDSGRNQARAPDEYSSGDMDFKL